MKTLETIYKRSEVEADTLAGFILAMCKHGLDDNDSIKHTGEFFCSLAKASNYDTTLMFINDSEKEKLLEIQQSLQTLGDELLLAKYEIIYGNL